jgi:ABC-type bacteriocin/lantibiotic exporter with double-glycine peptidase domain
MTELFAGMIICFIIFWTLFVEVRYEQTLLLLAVYVGASFRLLPSINRILNSLVQIRSHQYVLSELQPRNDLKVSKADINAIPFQDRIVLEGISFSFSNRPSLFQNLNLEIRKGEKVAIVGKSGSGKSSLLLILLGILKATEGKIRLDSTAIAEGNRANYQCLFSYVSQNPYLFDGTIRQNVAFGLGTEKIDQERVKQALEQVDLADFVAQLPEKENTHIYEKGVTLSGGQRQRIALARAIYSNREILILDEVTNQLDQQTEAKVIESLQRITAENKTIIMVTHHPKLLPLFDLVLKLEDGKLSEVNLSASK